MATAADMVRDDLDRLLSFYDFLAEHSAESVDLEPHIESTFSTVRLRPNVTTGQLEAAGLPLAFMLVECV